MVNEKKCILGLDVSTKTIGISLFEDLGDKGKLLKLTHVSPNVKPKPLNSLELLMKKAQVFELEFLQEYADYGIERVIIEEPLMGSNNINTVATLIRFNGMICKSVYEVLNIVPEFISSYDARRYAFPELMEIRKIKTNGEPYTPKEISNKKPSLFGGYKQDIDKKVIIWEKVNNREPLVEWIYDKNQKLAKETYDLSDAYTCVLGFMQKNGFWK